MKTREEITKESLESIWDSCRIMLSEIESMRLKSSCIGYAWLFSDNIKAINGFTNDIIDHARREFKSYE